MDTPLQVVQDVVVPEPDDPIAKSLDVLRPPGVPERLAAFGTPDATPTLSSLLSLAPLAALLPLIMLVLIIVGRQADPIRRPEPLLTREEAKRARLERKAAQDAGPRS